MALTLAEDRAVTLADRVLQSIQNRIVSGDLAPGTKLNEDELARAQGISRGPLREALRRLEARRLVEVIPNIGARVVSLDVDQLQAVYQVREALEGMACRLAALRISRSEIDALGDLLDKHEATLATDPSEAYLQEAGDFDFHYRIARASGNEVLAAMLCDDLYHLVRMYRRRTDAAGGRGRTALAEHRRILEALANNDPELAELLMRRHVAAASSLLDRDTSQLTESTDERRSEEI